MDADPGFVRRIGVIGLGVRGRFVLERFAGQSPWEVIGCDPDAAARQQAAGLCVRCAKNPAELLADPQIETVILAAAVAVRTELAVQVLQAGKRLIVEPPIALSAAEAESVFAAARSGGGEVQLWTPWRGEADYRNAWQIARGESTELRMLRLERWTLPALDVTGSMPAFTRTAYAAFDQLIALAGEPPMSVSAVSLPSGGLLVWVRFESGVTATLSLYAAETSRLSSGWAIDASRSGYGNGRRWIRTEDGEVYDTAMPEPVPTVPEQGTGGDPRERLRQTGNGEFSAAAAEAMRMAVLMEGVQRSLQSGRVECVGSRTA